MTRVDKADILELTVFHLTQLQRQQRSVSIATEVAAYSAGFKDCAREAVTYLSSTRTENDKMIRSLSNHLYSSYTMMSKAHDGGVSMAASSRYRHGPQGSTPLRPVENLESLQQTMNIAEYSPIPMPNDISHLVRDITDLPELTSSFVKDGLNSTSDSGLASLGSNFSSSYSTYSSSDISGIESGENITSSDADLDIDVVTIGDGKENQIGHVIKETIWRPF